MAEPSYGVDQFPTIGSSPRAPHREYAVPERLTDWESVNPDPLRPSLPGMTASHSSRSDRSRRSGFC